MNTGIGFGDEPIEVVLGQRVHLWDPSHRQPFVASWDYTVCGKWNVRIMCWLVNDGRTKPCGLCRLYKREWSPSFVPEVLGLEDWEHVRHSRKEKAA